MIRCDWLFWVTGFEPVTQRVNSLRSITERAAFTAIETAFNGNLKVSFDHLPIVSGCLIIFKRRDIGRQLSKPRNAIVDILEFFF